jgi:hypothetical protein
MADGVAEREAGMAEVAEVAEVLEVAPMAEVVEPPKLPLVEAAPSQRPVRVPRRLRPSLLPRPDFRSVAERMEAGRALRRRCPRARHAEWRPRKGRDPLALLRRSDASRLPWLVPVRHERMALSPFAFLRGSPFVMTADLARSPVSGLRAQLCGDAHLGNFGLFATAERRLVFDVNDFDETLPGPVEWDVKRLAASCVVVARQGGFGEGTARRAARRAARAYRKALRRLAPLGLLEVWALHQEAEVLAQRASSGRTGEVAAKAAERARRRTSAHAVERLTVERDGKRHLAYQPPLLFPLEAVRAGISRGELHRRLAQLTRGYLGSLDGAMRELCLRYRRREWGFKVVGVGSVGLQAYVVLCEGNGEEDPLVLQVKEAQPSALELALGPSGLRSPAERVVVGQRRMQAGADPFLGWTCLPGMGDFYVRQLRDMKGGLDVEKLEPCVLLDYAAACGETLARAHARTGDAALMAGYLGGGDVFEEAVAEFAMAYAGQVEADHARFVDSRLPPAPPRRGRR